MEKEKFFLNCDRIIFAGLCLVIFCLPFSKAGAESFIWMAIVFWILKRIFGYRTESFWGLLPKTRLGIALSIYIFVNALAVIYSTNLGLSLRGFFGKELKFLVLFFMMVEVINNSNRLRNIFITIIASVVLISADAAVQYIRGVDFLRNYEWSLLRASFSTANGFACWLIVIIPSFLGLIASNRSLFKGSKILLLVLTIFLILYLLATYTRGAWLGFLVSILFIVWHIVKNFTLKVKLAYLFIGMVLIIIFLILPQPLRLKIADIGNIRFKYDTINTRLKSTLSVGEGSIPIRFNLWKEASKIIKDYNFTGCGLNTYSIIVRDYRSFEGGGIYPHNSYLQKAAEIGLFGLAAFFGVLFMFFKIGLWYFNQKKDYLVLGLLSGILAFLMHALFDNHFYSLQLVVLFWYMLGLTVAVIKLDCSINYPSKK